MRNSTNTKSSTVSTNTKSSKPKVVGTVSKVLGTVYRGEQNINFPKLWKSSLVLSALLILFSFAGFVTRGLDLGIDFNGGTAWEVQASDVSVAETRAALADTQALDAKIQTVGGDTIRVRSGIENVDEVTEILAGLAGVDIADVSVSNVGPSWGSQITAKARNALLIFFALIAAYIAVRLEWKMAVGALAAVVHDIVICVGVYSLFQFEITPATVIAFLTIMGYSLYDTIVVYDKVRDVVGRISASGRYTYTEMMNLSLNMVFMRSVNTSITSMIPVASMLIVGSFVLGAVTLQEFSIALLIGIAVGTYSSIFVAAALVAVMKEREPGYVAIAERVERRRRSLSSQSDVRLQQNKPYSNEVLDKVSSGDDEHAVLAEYAFDDSPDSAGAASDIHSSSPQTSALQHHQAMPHKSPVIVPRPRKRKRRK